MERNLRFLPMSARLVRKGERNHEKRLFIGTGIFMVLAVLLIASTTVAGANSTTLVVDDDLLDCPDAGYLTIELALDDAVDGDTIRICPGTYAGAEVDKSVEIRGTGGAIINDGPVHGSGLIQGFRLLGGSDGALYNVIGGTWRGNEEGLNQCLRADEYEIIGEL